MKILAAPLQGFTEAPWRRCHREVYGSAVACYYSPFVRVEGGEPRAKDLRDVASPLNVGVPFVPQIIFKDAAEFHLLTDALVAQGFGEIDLNLGCPFPPQVKRGRGCGAVANASLLGELADMMADEYPSTVFSLKMRLGAERPDEWRQAIDAINRMPLSHVAVHPRVGRQQYSGELWLGEFADFHARCRHPLVFNGDITLPGQIASLSERYPWLEGVMVGRGLLASPSLTEEYASGRDWTDGERLEKILELHSRLLAHYSDCLCGDSQILSKIKPYWDYLEPTIGHKAAKAIKKAGTMAKYNAAVGNISTIITER